jgi:hypothetical protein
MTASPPCCAPAHPGHRSSTPPGAPAPRSPRSPGVSGRRRRNSSPPQRAGESLTANKPHASANRAIAELR